MVGDFPPLGADLFEAETQLDNLLLGLLVGVLLGGRDFLGRLGNLQREGLVLVVQVGNLALELLAERVHLLGVLRLHLDTLVVGVLGLL